MSDERLKNYERLLREHERIAQVTAETKWSSFIDHARRALVVRCTLGTRREDHEFCQRAVFERLARCGPKPLPFPTPAPLLAWERRRAAVLNMLLADQFTLAEPPEWLGYRLAGHEPQ